MTTYFSFRPDYFNNNGDQGNIEVLRETMGSTFVETQAIDSADFVLIGDASLAVTEHFADELEKLREIIRTRFDLGLPTLIVGRSYEFYAAELSLTAAKTFRFSGFVETKDGVFGYKNSATDLPDVTQKGAFIGTNLFGPLLAKNPELLSTMLKALGAELVVDETRTRYVSEIRKRAISG